MTEVNESSGFQVRQMVRSDLARVYDWSIAQGWNIGKYDHDVFFDTDPYGFFLGELNGEPIGSVSGVSYGSEFGFIGMYIVAPQYRGKGFGLRIFNTAMEYLAGRSVGLDGVIEQQANYVRSGFTLAHRNIRYSWVPPPVLPIPDNIVAARNIDFERVVEYDERHFFAPRRTFLNGWIRQPESIALAAVSNGSITALGVVRRFDRGYCIGPLFAETPELAERMLLALGSRLPGETVYLDVPQVNADAVGLTESYGMAQVFETARMYTGVAPNLPLSSIYGITSFELG